MYHYEQENQILKADIMRRDNDNSQHINNINQSFRRNIENASPRRRQERPERQHRADRNESDRPDSETNQINAQNHNRRREFARERAGTTKP